MVSKSGVHVYKRKAWVRLDAKLGWWPSYLTIRTPAVVDKDGFGRNNLRLTELMFVEPVVPVVFVALTSFTDQGEYSRKKRKLKRGKQKERGTDSMILGFQQPSSQ
jgi:hypothetical protein